MLFRGCGTPGPVIGGIAAGATFFGMLIGAAGFATADPMEPAPVPAPPNCTAADLAQVSAGVAAQTSAYLFAHPDVNDYFTSLKTQPQNGIPEQLQDYMTANPQVHTDLQGIRQPLTDMRNRCQLVGD